MIWQAIAAVGSVAAVVGWVGFWVWDQYRRDPAAGLEFAFALGLLWSMLLAGVAGGLVAVAVLGWKAAG